MRREARTITRLLPHRGHLPEDRPWRAPRTRGRSARRRCSVGSGRPCRSRVPVPCLAPLRKADDLAVVEVFSGQRKNLQLSRRLCRSRRCSAGSGRPCSSRSSPGSKRCGGRRSPARRRSSARSRLPCRSRSSCAPWLWMAESRGGARVAEAEDLEEPPPPAPQPSLASVLFLCAGQVPAGGNVRRWTGTCHGRGARIQPWW